MDKSTREPTFLRTKCFSSRATINAANCEAGTASFERSSDTSLGRVSCHRLALGSPVEHGRPYPETPGTTYRAPQRKGVRSIICQPKLRRTRSRPPTATSPTSRRPTPPLVGLTGPTGLVTNGHLTAVLGGESSTVGFGSDRPKVEHDRLDSFRTEPKFVAHDSAPAPQLTDDQVRMLTQLSLCVAQFVVGVDAAAAGFNWDGTTSSTCRSQDPSRPDRATDRRRQGRALTIRRKRA